MKKEFACNGTVVSSADSSDEESPAPGKSDFGKVLQFQGDQRLKVKDFLVASGLITDKEAKEQIVMSVPSSLPLLPSILLSPRPRSPACRV